jgi:hypothetical protein
MAKPLLHPALGHRVVQVLVIRSAANQQILVAIVRLATVDVMNVFSRLHATTKDSLCNLSMLKDVLSGPGAACVFSCFLSRKPDNSVATTVAYPTIFASLHVCRATIPPTCSGAKTEHILWTAT